MMSPASTQETLCTLAIDIGTDNTRALLFDVVEESYHFIAAGIAPSTHQAPLFDASMGVLDALNQLQEITGRMLINQHASLIIPSQAGNEGVDRLFVTYSTGKQLKIAVFGLMNDVSLQSAHRLAATINSKIVQSISINDPRIIHDQIDETLLARPDLILFAGGTDQGATRSIKKMANLISAILRLIPLEQRPPVVFSGNQLMSKPVKEILEPVAQVTTTANIRPSLEKEELNQASQDLANLVTQIQFREINGLNHLASISSDTPCPSATALGRIVRYLSKVGDPEKGILAVDIGSGSTTTASAIAGQMELNVLPFGSAHGLAQFLQVTAFEEISQWFTPEIDEESARDHLWQKTLFPGSVPLTHEGVIIEQAATRQMLHLVMRELAQRGALIEKGYDSILLSGAAITQIGTPSQLLLMILDGLQPRGISTLILDTNSLLPALGASARVLPVMPVQVLETKAFTNLATVIPVVGNAHAGTTIGHARLRKGEKASRTIEVKQGTLTYLPLRIGDSATLEFELNRGAQIESFDYSETSFKVKGGLCGIIFDTRGRPIKLPADKTKRGALFQLWNEALGKTTLV